MAVRQCTLEALDGDHFATRDAVEVGHDEADVADGLVPHALQELCSRGQIVVLGDIRLELHLPPSVASALLDSPVHGRSELVTLLPVGRSLPSTVALALWLPAGTIS